MYKTNNKCKSFNIILPKNNSRGISKKTTTCIMKERNTMRILDNTKPLNRIRRYKIDIK